VQTTLLGLAIAIILALVAALVAPLVVDWNQYRSVFEAEASRLTGLPVRVNGSIDASILPTPHIKLRNVEVGEAGRDPQARAATVELEVGLGPLLAGEVRATQLRLVAPQIRLGLDRSGAVDWPARARSFSPEALAVSRFNVEDGQVVLTDAVSGSRLVLQKLWFNGDIRSFLGPFKGEGAFVAGDQLYGYRISGNRADEDGALKLRLAVDPSERPLTAEIEGTLRFDRGMPQFDGTLALARPAGAALARGERVMSDPWRLAGKLKATPALVSLEELALLYGPEERAVSLNGKADLTLGGHPRLDGTVSARQLDVDRALAAPDVTRRPPFLVLKSFVEAFVATAKPPLPLAVGVNLDAVTVGGTSIQAVHGDIRFDDKGWNLKDLDFRAPGLSQVKLTGRLDDTAQGLAFSGPASIESTDLKMLVAWLEGRGDQPSGPSETLTAHGDVTIARGRLAIDHLTATADQENIAGRLAYTWAADDRHPAVLDGELHAQQLDIDALVAFAKAATTGSAFEAPREVALVLDVGKATFAGVEARTVNAQVKFDAGVLRIDRLSVGDVGGAALDISGRIDELSSQPRGRVTFAVDARSLAGLGSLLGRFAPQAGEPFRRVADRLAPAKLHGVLVVDRAATAGTAAKLTLDGSVGATRIALNGEAKGELAQPAAAVVRIDSRFDADDGGALARLLGLDRVVAVDQLPGQMTISAAGPLNSELRVNAVASAGGFSVTADGAIRLSGDEAPTGRLQVKASAADLRPLRRVMTGQAAPAALPVSASAALAVAGATLSFTDLAVTSGKTTVRGHLALKLASPFGIDGEIKADEIDAAAVLAALVGAPSPAPAASAPWSPEPFGAGMSAAMNGVVTFTADRAALTPDLVARSLTGVMQLKPAEIALSNLDAGLAGGRLAGELAFRHDAQGVSAQGRIELLGANAAAILRSGANAVDGRLTVKLQGDSVGRSPEGFIGSLHGSGAVALADGHFAGIDTAAFDAAIRAADLNDAIDAPKLRTAVGAAIDSSRLSVPRAEAEVTIAGGQIRLANATLQAQRGGELSLSGMLDLNAAAIDARMTLSSRPAANALIQARPEYSVTVKGPLAAPARTLDVSSLLGWLTLRSAELQTRRLESIEANRREEAVGSVVRPASPAIRFVPLGTPLESAVQVNAAPPAAFGGRGLERLQPETPAASPPNETRSDVGGADHGADHDAAAAANGAKPAPQHADGATANAGTPDASRRRAAPPPVSHNPFDFLFRSQN
jgi:large subunit ribosomal protein L24